MSAEFEAAIEKALKDLADQKFHSIRAAAKFHKVDKRTLTRRKNGGGTRRNARVKQQLLTALQEELLVRWVLDLQRCGHAPTHAQVRDMALQISITSGGPNHVGNHWVPRFLQRHSELSTQTGRKTETTRTPSTTSGNLPDWLPLFRRGLTEFKIPAENRWNADESGIAGGIRAKPTVVGSSSPSRFSVKEPANREWMLSIQSIAASGRELGHLLTFRGEASVLRGWIV